jgi:hypothetical protein
VSKIAFPATTAGAAVSVVILGAMLAMSTAGCKQAEPDFRTEALVGTVEEIDLAGARMRVSFYGRKHERRERVVRVTPDTEIFINGVAARLDDLRVGERADGVAVITRHDEREVIRLTRIHVSRPGVAIVPDPRARSGPRDG